MTLSITQLPYLTNSDHLLYNLKPYGHRVALESSNPEHPNGRWSIISASPVESIELTSKPDTASIITRLTQLQNRLPYVDSNLPFTGGLIGHISYDFGVAGIQQDLKHFPDQPLMLCGLYTWAYVIDHQLKTSHLVYWPDISNEDKQDLEALFLDSLASNTTKEDTFKLTSPFNARWNKHKYKTKIETILEYILSGDVYQVNLAQSFHAVFAGDPVDAYSKIKSSAKVPFASYFESHDWAFASASPELFLQCDDETVTTKPIKGTRPRHTDPVKDQQQVDELRQSSKDKAENLMIVDLLRNDLSMNAKNVRVDKLFDIESFNTVHHLVSTISASINGTQAIKLLIDAFPGGSITGAPKKRAMEIIAELEQAPRSFYCGSSFYISSNKKMNSNILIRGFLFNSNNVTCWAGGGIVADSNWEDEYQESLDKISKLMQSLN
jgi:para-aminobenzoate synthetase component 1